MQEWDLERSILDPGPLLMDMRVRTTERATLVVMVVTVEVMVQEQLVATTQELVDMAQVTARVMVWLMDMAVTAIITTPMEVGVDMEDQA